MRKQISILMCIFVFSLLFYSIVFASSKEVNIQPSNAKITCDEKLGNFNGYVINNYTYYSLDDLSDLLMFGYDVRFDTLYNNDLIGIQRSTRSTSEEIMKITTDMNANAIMDYLGETRNVASNIRLEYAIENGYYVGITSSLENQLQYSTDGPLALSQKYYKPIFPIERYVTIGKNRFNRKSKGVWELTYGVSSLEYSTPNADEQIKQKQMTISQLFSAGRKLEIKLDGYLIKGEYYFKLRDFCDMFGAVVDYDKTKNDINVMAYIPRFNNAQKIAKIKPEMTRDDIFQLLGKTIDVGHNKIILQYEIENQYFVNIHLAQEDTPCGISGDKFPIFNSMFSSAKKTKSIGSYIKMSGSYMPMNVSMLITKILNLVNSLH